MISYETYKIIHFFGLFLALLSLGGLCFIGAIQAYQSHPWRRLASVTHGVGLFLVLLGGFGMLARLGLSAVGLPGWVIGKLVLWLFLGAVLVLIKRQSSRSHLWVSLIFVAVLGASVLAILKP